MEILTPIAVALFVAGIVALVTGWYFRYQLPFWARWKWLELLWSFRSEGSHLPIVTLDEYVKILESLRTTIVERCKDIRDSTPKITVCVYTMQLPSDWPLWEKVDAAHVPNKTPLELYFHNFAEFLSKGAENHYSVQVQRIIVIDYCNTERSQRKLAQLVKDVQSDDYQNYLTKLHGGDSSGVYFCAYPRPWPGWLSDAVFYAVTDHNNVRRWLWGITTSYNPNEDLVILRKHPLYKKARPSGNCKLPSHYETLQEFADIDASANFFQPLTLENVAKVMSPTNSLRG